MLVVSDNCDEQKRLSRPFGTIIVPWASLEGKELTSPRVIVTCHSQQ